MISGGEALRPSSAAEGSGGEASGAEGSDEENSDSKGSDSEAPDGEASAGEASDNDGSVLWRREVAGAVKCFFLTGCCGRGSSVIAS